MSFGLFEIISILAFSFICYLCYNLFVANIVKKNAQLRLQLETLLADKALMLTTDIKTYLTGEGYSLDEQSMPILYNEKPLDELLVDTAKDDDYNYFLDVICNVVQDLYKNYQFLRQDPAVDDYNSGYYLAFQFIRGEYPEEYEFLFRLAVDKGLDPIKLNKLFVERVANGQVLELGTAEIDTTQTGISSILQGQDVRVSITFAPKEYMEKKQELLDERKKEYDARVAEQQELAEQKDSALKAVRLAETVLNSLVDEIAEKHELQELVNKTKESMGYL